MVKGTSVAISLIGLFAIASSQDPNDVVVEAANDELNIFKVCGSGFGPVSCSCKPKLWPPSVSATCGFDTPICFPPGSDSGTCGFPALEIGFKLGNILTFSSPATFKVCYNDLSVGGSTVQVPVPLCFGLGSGGLKNLFSILFPFATADSNTSCEASLGDYECAMCSTCQDANGNDGVRFSCEDAPLGEDLFADECLALGVEFQ